MKNIVKISPNKEFMVIDLVKEYAGATAFVGTEHYAIVTDLSEEDLFAAFSQELEPYKPFVIITQAMYEAIAENKTNDQLAKLRDRRYHEPLSVESMLHLIDEMSDPISICDSIHILEYLTEQMLKLPDHQGSRIYKRYVLGYTIKEIANKDGVSIMTVYKSISEARPSLYKLFVECGVVA